MMAGMAASWSRVTAFTWGRLASGRTIEAARTRVDLRRLVRNISDKTLVEKMEQARVNLTGCAVPSWTSGRILGEGKSDAKLAKLSGWAKGRFKKGKAAVPYAELVKVSKKVGTTFESDAAFKVWIKEENFRELAADQIIKVASSVRPRTSWCALMAIPVKPCR